MKKLLLLAACFMFGLAAQAQDVSIEKRVLGFGDQNVNPKVASLQNAKTVGDLGVFHVPGYLPFYPTSATIWPRVVDVKCNAGKCAGYNWNPGDGRAEYLFFRPVQ